MPSCKKIMLLWLLAVGVARSTTIVPPEFPQLVNDSDYVVRARIKSVMAELRVQEGRKLIFTRIQLEVIEVIAGNPPANPELLMLGGALGGEELWIEGVPRFAVGEEDVLFVQGNGVNFHPLCALGHGRYPVKIDPAGREYMTRSNGAPLHDVAEVRLPITEGAAAPLRASQGPGNALSPAAFINSIKAVRTAATRREK